MSLALYLLSKKRKVCERYRWCIPPCRVISISVPAVGVLMWISILMAGRKCRRVWIAGGKRMLGIEELKFRTKTGYCYILPDKIVLTRDGKIGEAADAFSGPSVEGKSMKNSFMAIIKSMLILLLISVLCFLAGLWSWWMGRKYDAVFLFGGTILTFGFFLFYGVGLLLSLHNSATPVVYRNTIEKVRFHKALSFLTRAYFTVYFRDKKGKRKKRLIPLPGSLSGGEEAIKKALEVMKLAKLI